MKKILKKYSNIKVSVVMPVYNGVPDHLIKAVLSILSQTHSNIELILIDDCSDNETIQNILSSFLSDIRVQLIRNIVNIGVAKSLNKGMNLSTGKYIFRMDSDDISNRNRLINSIHFLEKNKHVDILGSNALSIGNKILPIIMPKFQSQITFAMFSISPFVHPTVVFRGSFLNRIPKYYSDVVAEDYDFWVECHINYDANFHNLSKFNLFYRKHNGQISSVKKLMNHNSFLDSNKKLAERKEINNYYILFINFLMGLTNNNYHSFTLFKENWISIMSKLNYSRYEQRQIKSYLCLRNFIQFMKYRDFIRLKVMWNLINTK